ncbi:PqqD family protein [Defluviitalea phaphyphila]|uniref:PqqD family protein n=1 Tax=Defluviitalea phaphyphila TaxID=1473580 RepID=UPI00072FB053|nr:PqqD family protein [Defluviitalea phaphyphila]
MKKSKNILNMIPIKNERILWETKNGLVTLIILRNRPFDKFMHKIFKTPLKTTIELDEIGSFVWNECDGTKTINDIAENLEEKFGKRVQPVLERLLTYIRTLINNSFIILK